MANRYTIKLYGKRRGWVAKVWRSATKIIQWFIRDTIVSRICRTETFSSPSILFFPQRVKTTKQRWKRLISSSRKRKGEEERRGRKKDRRGMKMRESSMNVKKKKRNKAKATRLSSRINQNFSSFCFQFLPCWSFEFSRVSSASLERIITGEISNNVGSTFATT